MSGTLLCGVDDSDGGRRALMLSMVVSRRLKLRLVVAHVAEVVRLGTVDPSDEDDSWRDRQGAERRLAAVARECDLGPTVERRIDVGDVADCLARFAAEEAADLIIIGGERKGRFRRRVASATLERLNAETSVPVLVALPRVHATAPKLVTAVPG